MAKKQFGLKQISKFINNFELYLRASFNTMKTPALIRKCSNKLLDIDKEHHLEAKFLCDMDAKLKFTSVCKLNKEGKPYINLHLDPSKYEKTWGGTDLIIAPVQIKKGVWEVYYIAANRFLDFCYGLNNGITTKMKDGDSIVDISFKLMYRSIIGVSIEELMNVNSQLNDKIIVRVDTVYLDKKYDKQYFDVKYSNANVLEPTRAMGNNFIESIHDNEKHSKLYRWSMIDSATKEYVDYTPLAAIYRGRTAEHVNVAIYNQKNELKHIFKNVADASKQLNIDPKLVRDLIEGKKNKTYAMKDSSGNKSKIVFFDDIVPYSEDEFKRRFSRKQRSDKIVEGGQDGNEKRLRDGLR